MCHWQTPGPPKPGRNHSSGAGCQRLGTSRSDTYVRAAEVLLAFSAFEQAYTVLLLNLA